jgi:hypothetical protein
MEAIITFDLKKGLSKNGSLSLNDETILQKFYHKTKCNVVIITKNNERPISNLHGYKNRLHIVLTRETKKYKEITEQIKYALFNHRENISENLLLFPKNYNDTYNILNKFLQLFFPNRFEISKKYIIPSCKSIWVTENKEESSCDLMFDYQLENMFNEEKVFENNEYKIYKYTKQ